jgi:hypothetical protein
MPNLPWYLIRFPEKVGIDSQAEILYPLGSGRDADELIASLAYHAVSRLGYIQFSEVAYALNLGHM